MASGGGVIYPQKNGKGAARYAAQRLEIYMFYLFFFPKMLLPDSPSRSPIDAAN